MDLKPRGGRSRSVFRIRGGMAVVFGLTLIAIFLSYNLLQGTVNIGQLLQSVLSEEDNPEPRLEVDSYLVWSPSCQIPNIHPFHASIRKFITRAAPIVCSNKPPLTYTTIVPENKHQYMLKINSSAIDHYTVHSENISCCYSVVVRVNGPTGKQYNRTADNYFSISDCVSFEMEVMLKPEEEFVLVRCNDPKKPKQKREVYVNMHAVVPIKQAIRSKFNKSSSERNLPENKQRLSVLILGFDSISRLNMQRTMPKTVGHLRRNGWLELLGYNKVGENTLPNAVAFLAGMNQDQLVKECWASSHTKFDDCPFVWREFSNIGYTTAYIEDEPTGGTFNYHKTGFAIPPTDYYIRPFLLAAETKMPVKQRDYLNVCLGPTPTSEHILRYITNFATVFKSALYFAMVWLNNFSHSNSATPGTMDGRVLQFFHELEETGALNTTLVIFLSDHGMRWGEIRKTSVGWLEERLPFIYFWVPEWFKEKYPDEYKNLKTNRNRLTSPFDLHMTFKHVLEMSGQENKTESLTGCLGCDKCSSLFSEVSADRSCEDAGITPNWCTCNKYRSIPTKGKAVKAVALYVLSEINSKLKKWENSTKLCAELSFDHVIKMKRKVQQVQMGQPINSFDDYVVMFDTLPGGAVFEATVGRSRSIHDSSSTFQLKGGVSRINTYVNQSECVDDAELKFYCYCI